MEVIPITNKRYSATDNGKIYSHITNKTLKTIILNSGYESVMIRIAGKSKRFLVHRLVMMAYKKESNLTVNHINGIKTDNRLINLEYMTHRQNEQHAYKIGLKTRIEYEDIRDRYESGVPLRKIAKFMKVKHQSIMHVLRRDLDEEAYKNLLLVRKNIRDGSK